MHRTKGNFEKESLEYEERTSQLISSIDIRCSSEKPLWLKTISNFQAQLSYKKSNVDSLRVEDCVFLSLDGTKRVDTCS